MPIAVSNVVTTLTPQLVATAHLGPSVTQLATGIANGVSAWVAALSVTTVDAGSLGVGSGQVPFLVPQSLLLGSFTTSFASFQIKGIQAPLTVLGLSNGLALVFPQGIVKTTHPSVGTGAGVAKFAGPSAVPFMTQGFATAGMTGPSLTQLASAIGVGLDQVISVFTIPVPIVGSASPASSSGMGFGKII